MKITMEEAAVTPTVYNPQEEPVSDVLFATITLRQTSSVLP